jgi:hypothetical protein
MRRKLLPGIVVTVSALGGCQGSTPGPDPQPSSTSSQSAADPSGTAKPTTSTAKPTPSTELRKRKVSRANFERKRAEKPNLVAMTLLNPRHQGRAVMTNKSGSCYVMLPPGPDAPPLPPGSRLGTQKMVDCPAAMDDPAWDSCFDDELGKLASGACVCLPSYGNPPPPPSQAECPGAGETGATATVHHSYTGQVSLPSPAPNEPAADLPMRVIRDAASFEQLVRMIPVTQITKRRPSPPSDDPLLERPDIDWSKHMMVVVFRANTMYVPPKLERPRQQNGKLVLELSHPPLGDTANAAAMMGIGTYCAIVIDRFDGDVALRAVDAPR